MRIALFITTIKKRNTGFGGHYRSLLSYYHKLLEAGHSVIIMHYNQLDNSILDNEAENKLAGVTSFNGLVKHCKKILDREVDVVISFADSLQSRALRLLCYNKDVKYIQVLPGGWSRKMPLFFNNCIYFSTENLSNRTDYSINKFLLTNRVDDYSCDDVLIKDFKTIYPQKKINILRVSRISREYFYVFVATVNFHKYLKSQGYDVQTHLIGIKQDITVYNLLCEEIEGVDDIYIVTDEKFTKEVKMLMEYFNVVVGIGRGFWEAVSKKAFVLGYSAINKLPIIVNQDNYDLVREFNFSPRTIVDGVFAADNNLEIITDFESKTHKDYVEFLYDKYLTDYSSSGLADKILSVINKSTEDKLPLVITSLVTILFSEVYHIFYKDFVTFKKIDK